MLASPPMPAVNADRAQAAPDDVDLSPYLERSPRRLSLAQLPTPVQRVPGLDVGSAEVWVKRDDASSDIYGGGKVRKLEWVLANPPYDGDEAARQAWLDTFHAVLADAPAKYGFPKQHMAGFVDFLDRFSGWMVNAE